MLHAHARVESTMSFSMTIRRAPGETSWNSSESLVGSISTSSVPWDLGGQDQDKWIASFTA